VPTKPLRLAAVPLIAGAILSGCGSSHKNTPTCPSGEQFCVSQNTNVPVGGSTDLATNLIKSIKKSNPPLKHVSLQCPSKVDKFPTKCILAGEIIAKGKPIKVRGEVSAFGIDTRTHTYAYSVNYAPVHSPGT
jgi:hypothetical protein